MMVASVSLTPSTTTITSVSLTPSTTTITSVSIVYAVITTKTPFGSQSFGYVGFGG